MDLSEQYIKMCAALPAVVHIERNEFDIMAVFHGPDFKGFLHEPRVVDLLKSRGVDPTYLRCSDFLAWYAVPLPRLEQIQELYVQKWDTFFQNCIDWKNDLDEIGALPISRSTAEQVALTRIMYENYGLIWTGEKWEMGEY